MKGEDNELITKNDDNGHHNGESELDKRGEDESTKRMIDEELYRHYLKLFREDKIGNRREMLEILTVMLHSGEITVNDFQKISNTLFSAKENEVTEPNDETLIQETVEYLTKNDKDKLRKLIEKFKKLES